MLKIVLIVFGIFLLFCVASLILPPLIGVLNIGKPTQNLPVADYEWGKVVVAVAQLQKFGIGKPGQWEFHLHLAPYKHVGRCPGVEDPRPTFTAVTRGTTVQLTLHPVKSGGKCGAKHFEAGDQVPEDPRYAEVILPDVTRGPVSVEIIQGEKKSTFEIHWNKAEMSLVRAPGVRGGKDFVEFAYSRMESVAKFYVVQGLGQEFLLSLGYGGRPPYPAQGNVSEISDQERLELFSKSRGFSNFVSAETPFDSGSGNADYRGNKMHYVAGRLIESQQSKTIQDLYEEALQVAKKNDMPSVSVRVYEFSMDGATREFP